MGQEHFGGEKEPREGQSEWEVVNKATRLVLDQQAGEEKNIALELGEDKWTSLEIGFLNTTKQLRIFKFFL